ncbi:hypothetical protein ACROYT_G033769 [Oculina patagonica]
MLMKMGPAFLLTFLVMSSLVFSCIKSVPLVHAKTLAIEKDSGTHRDEENPKVTNYISFNAEAVMKNLGEWSPKDGLAAKFKVNEAEHKRIFTKGRAARGVRRCFSAWMRCPYKSKEQHRRDRNQRTERKGSAKQHSG